jgi:S-adenosylmethionine:tRNA ribosyltransferase-isomerase
MRVDEFDYLLPPELIASRPVEPRHNARLLVSRAAELLDQTVLELPEQLNPGDLLVFNNTRVIPARLEGLRGAARIELLLHRKRADGSWEAFAKPLKKLKEGDRIEIADGFTAVVKGRVDDQVLLDFDCGARTLAACLEAHGHLPLPHYMNRADDAQDKRNYQTIFAQYDGAVAAPTASLHFTPELMERLAARGIEHTFITLHVGAGTFQPVRVDDIKDHVMHHEWAEVTAEAAVQMNTVKAKGGRIVAVGTTVMRTLETCAKEQAKIPSSREAIGVFAPYRGDTNIFITPGFEYKAVDALVTNFHLPKSTLLMLVSAYIGMDRAKALYQHAITNKYRFYSYGDSSLLFPG